MEPVNCPECARLQRDIEEVLQQLIRLSSTELDVLRSNDYQRFMRLEKDLDAVMGTKQRLIGGMREHERTHEATLR